MRRLSVCRKTGIRFIRSRCLSSTAKRTIPVPLPPAVADPVLAGRFPLRLVLLLLLTLERRRSTPLPIDGCCCCRLLGCGSTMSAGCNATRGTAAEGVPPHCSGQQWEVSHSMGVCRSNVYRQSDRLRPRPTTRTAVQSTAHPAHRIAK